MGLLTPCFVPRGGSLYTRVVPESGFCPLRVVSQGACPEGMVTNEIDSRITEYQRYIMRIFKPIRTRMSESPRVLTLWRRMMSHLQNRELSIETGINSKNL